MEKLRNRDKENYRKWKREWYLKNRDKEIERKKRYYKTEAGKLASKKSNETAYQKYRYKVLARKLVQKALLRGKLKKEPCEKCGELKVDAHHLDYLKPLEVVWLCRKHHIELHRGERKKDKGKYKGW